MKKYFKLIFILICILNNSKVKAMEYGKLNITYEENIYYTLTDNKGLYISELFPFYTINDAIVYCITPSESVNTFDYKGAEGAFYFPYNAGIHSEFDRIGHYGYEYPNHNTIKYRLATQALIWETLGKNVEFWTEKNESGEKIDITKEKEEIKNLVNNHLKVPSFNNTTITNYVNNEIVIEDNKDRLFNFEVINDGGNKVEIKNNKLYITSFEPGESKIKLANMKYDDEISMIYVGNETESKRVGKFRTSSIITSNITVNTIGAKIKLINVDSKTKEKLKIKGIKFKIKNINTNEYICENDSCIYETNDEGIFITNNYFAGNYQIEKIDNVNGYLNDDKIISFSIDENTILDSDYIYKVYYDNERILSSIKINVIGQKVNFLNDTYNYEDIPLENVIYGLYANEDIYSVNKLIYKKDELIKELTTDEKGEVISDNLELDKYYLKQLKSSNDNIIDEKKYEFILDKNTKEFKFNNYLSKGILEINKDIDELNLIEIYYKDDTNKDLLIYKEYQNNNITINNLPLGKYYLKENEQKISFEINNNSKHVKLSIKNYKVFDIPNTYSNNLYVLNFIILTIFTIILGYIRYEKI